MRIAWRWVELRLLLLMALLVPLGFVVTHVAINGVLEAGPMHVAIGYIALFLAAHAALVLAGYRGDQLLLPAVATIGGVGIVMHNRLPIETSAFGLRMAIAETQLVWFAIGVVAMLAVAIGMRNDSLLRHYKYTWATGGAVLLIITFLFGTEVGGARLWIHIGPINFQPGEFIKIALVVFIAGYLAETRALLAGASLRIGPIALPPVPYLLPMVAMFAIVMGIVVFSRDLGTALLFFGIFLTMLFVATGRRTYVAGGLLLFVAGAWVAYELFAHVRVRVNAWIDPFADPLGEGYQVLQAMYAFARGGLFGEGLGQGLPTVGGRLPIPALPTDFIFTAIAEELGLIGALGLMALVLIVVFRGLRIGMLARDDFSMLLAVGLTTSLGLQSLIIIAGNLKVIPLTGITLPFVSFGGSSLLASFIVIGLLLSISHRSSIEPPDAESRA